MDIQIRHSTLNDVRELECLIALSARELGKGDYTSAQIEAALGSAWGVDTQLIRDQTYFSVESGSSIIACGGWSKRQALFGADALTRDEPRLLDPSREAARIRAFFVHPAWARRGIGRLLLEECETEARAAAFGYAELVATLPGQRLYLARGYRPLEPIEHPLPGGLTITFVPMIKDCL
jgi:GNAT superfamily N-acetyltransferase